MRPNFEYLCLPVMAGLLLFFPASLAMVADKLLILLLFLAFYRLHIIIVI